MSEEIRRRRENRKQFLELLYDASEAGDSEYLDAYELAEQLGLGRQDAERIVRYLEDHGWVTLTGRHGLTARITARGIDHVEGNEP